MPAPLTPFSVTTEPIIYPGAPEMIIFKTKDSWPLAFARRLLVVICGGRTLVFGDGGCCVPLGLTLVQLAGVLLCRHIVLAIGLLSSPLSTE